MHLFFELLVSIASCFWWQVELIRTGPDKRSGLEDLITHASASVWATLQTVLVIGNCWSIVDAPTLLPRIPPSGFPCPCAACAGLARVVLTSAPWGWDQIDVNEIVVPSFNVLSRYLAKDLMYMQWYKNRIPGKRFSVRLTTSYLAKSLTYYFTVFTKLRTFDELDQQQGLALASHKRWWGHT